MRNNLIQVLLYAIVVAMMVGAGVLGVFAFSTFIRSEAEAGMVAGICSMMFLILYRMGIDMLYRRNRYGR